MADKPKLSGGATVVPNEYDKFVKDNIGKAIIGIPEGDGGVKPITNANPTTVDGPSSNTIEMPVGLTAAQQIAMQAAFKAIMQGVTLAPAQQGQNVNAPPQQRDMIVPDTQNRMWNPMQEFKPTASLSQMEASVHGVNQNPAAVISHARPLSNLNPKDGCSPVLLDAFNTLTALVAGRWLLPGSPSVETLLVRLRAEIENK